MEKNKENLIEMNEEILLDNEEIGEEENQDELLNDEDFNIELINEKFDKIMHFLESINIDKEIGEKEKKKDSRIMIEKIELENFKSYAGVKKIYPLHNVRLSFLKYDIIF